MGSLLKCELTKSCWGEGDFTLRSCVLPSKKTTVTVAHTYTKGVSFATKASSLCLYLACWGGSTTCGVPCVECQQSPSILRGVVLLFVQFNRKSRQVEVARSQLGVLVQEQPAHAQ